MLEQARQTMTLFAWKRRLLSSQRVEQIFKHRHDVLNLSNHLNRRRWHKLIKELLGLTVHPGTGGIEGNRGSGLIEVPGGPGINFSMAFYI